MYIFKVFSDHTPPPNNKKNPVNSMRTSPGHILVKLLKIKRENVEAARETAQHVRYKRMTVRMPANFLSETMENQGEIKIISDKIK